MGWALPPRLPQTVLEIPVAKVRQTPERPVRAQLPDVRQGHPIEGVVLAGGIDGHIAKDEPLPLGEGGGKAVIADHIPRKAGGPAQTDGAGLLPGSPASSSGGR